MSKTTEREAGRVAFANFFREEVINGKVGWAEGAQEVFKEEWFLEKSEDLNDVVAELIEGGLLITTRTIRK